MATIDLSLTTPNPSSSSAIEYTGWLRKQGGKFKSWKRRFFVLDPDLMTLTYYTDEDRRDKLGRFSILNTIVSSDRDPVQYDTGADKNYIFVIEPAHEGTNLTSTHERFILSAQSSLERKTWIRAIRKVQFLKEGGAIFGTPLEEVYPYTKPEHEYTPRIVYETVQFVIDHGMNMEGIFRKSAVQTQIQQLADEYDTATTGPLLIPDKHSPHLAACLLKLYLRELPQVLLTASMVSHMVEQVKQSGGGDDEAEKEIVDKFTDYLSSNLDDPTYAMLSFLCRFLYEVSQHESSNKMTIENLACIFAPNIIYWSQSNSTNTTMKPSPSGGGERKSSDPSNTNQPASPTSIASNESTAGLLIEMIESSASNSRILTYLIKNQAKLFAIDIKTRLLSSVEQTKADEPVSESPPEPLRAPLKRSVSWRNDSSPHLRNRQRPQPPAYYDGQTPYQILPPPRSPPLAEQITSPWHLRPPESTINGIGVGRISPDSLTQAGDTPFARRPTLRTHPTTSNPFGSPNNTSTSGRTWRATQHPAVTLKPSTLNDDRKSLQPHPPVTSTTTSLAASTGSSKRRTTIRRNQSMHSTLLQPNSIPLTRWLNRSNSPVGEYPSPIDSHQEDGRPCTPSPSPASTTSQSMGLDSITFWRRLALTCQAEAECQKGRAKKLESQLETTLYDFDIVRLEAWLLRQQVEQLTKELSAARRREEEERDRSSPC